ncbi:MAG TPA: hypothetical protein VFN49_12890, partial [Candidatus Aquilonibacter sp.]|nr:hypothetical protein [Candidatus Aquilonibacter sp.]
LGMAQQILAIVLETTDVFEAAGARLLAAAERVGAIGQRVVALSLLAQGAYRRLDIERARALRDEVYRAIDEHDIMINSVAVRNNLTLAEREIGNIDYAVREWERAYQIADGLRATSAMICSLVNRAEVFVENGKPLEGIALARRVVEMVRKSGERRFMIDAEMVLAQGFFATGRRAEALQIMKRVAVEREETKSLRSLSNDLCILIESLVTANRKTDLPPYVAQLRELYSLGRERVTYPTRVCAALSAACEALGDAAGARRYRFEGKTVLEQMLEKLPDDGTRAGFALMNFNRYLMEPKAEKAAVGLNNR